MGQARRKQQAILATLVDWRSYPEHQTVTLTEAQTASIGALEQIRNRSFAGRHPELGRMINCQVCGFRHRQNERKCEQKFAVPLTPPEGLTQLTNKQLFGAKAYAKLRINPHGNRWTKERIFASMAKKRKLDRAKKVEAEKV